MSVLSLVWGLQESPVDSWFEMVLPEGRRTPVETVRQLSHAAHLVARLQAEIERRLLAERERTRRPLQALQAPVGPQMAEAYELLQAGLEEQWEALELLEHALAGRDDLLAEAVAMSENADRALDDAEQLVAEVYDSCPLVA